MTRRLPLASRLALTAGLAAFIVTVPAWTNPAWASAATSHTAPAPKHSALSGKWSGSYSGSFSGTFKLNWQQSGHNLGGTIMISGFKNVPTSIHGTVQGTAIRFGTVGSEAITYLGSVSGGSMSGTWKIQAAGRSMGGGSWNASKSS
jgi:hypothetical protein